jgi:uncharacterized damage-inducible protein DinB
MDGKRQMLQELQAARDELWAALETLDENTEIYPGWKKREFFTHVAGWEAMVFDVFHRHVTHQEPKDYGYAGEDKANERFVQVRQSLTLEDARLECEINRFAILTLLESMEADEEIQLPWGTETVTKFLRGAIDHERRHTTDIRQLESFRTASIENNQKFI